MPRGARTPRDGPAPGRVLAGERAAGLDARRRPTAPSTSRRARPSASCSHFLIGAKREGKRIAAYGAAAKGNTLLNYCGIRGDFIDYVVDRSPHKQGRYLPGTRIPVVAAGAHRARRGPTTC